MAKYSKEMVNKLVEAIDEGKGRVGACKYAGISYDTFSIWMKDENKSELSEAIKKAEDKFNVSIDQIAVMSIVSAMKKNWTAAAWWLERKHPETFGKKMIMAGDKDNPISLNIKGLVGDSIGKVYGKD